MNTFAVVLLSLAAVVSATPVQKYRDGLPVVSDYVQGEKCPAKNFYVECNSCICTESGDGAACTMMFCLPEFSGSKVEDNVDSVNVALPVIHDFTEGDKCPAERFYIDCNVCFCNGGNVACTRMACPSFIQPRFSTTEEQEPRPVIYEWKKGDKCPAKYFFFDCNACICGSDGETAGCTRMICPARDE